MRRKPGEPALEPCGTRPLAGSWSARRGSMPRWMTRRDERGAATRHVQGDQGPGGGNGIGSQSCKSRPCYLAGPSVAAVNKIKTGLPFQRPNASLRRAALERSRGRSRGAVDMDGDGAHLHHQNLVDRACHVSSPRASGAVDEQNQDRDRSECGWRRPLPRAHGVSSCRQNRQSSGPGRFR